MRVLVSRFSSIGDVALTVPILHAIKLYHPGIDLVMLSRPQFRSLFQPLDIQFMGVDLQNKHKGLPGLWELKKEIITQVAPDKIVDLHHVLRTRILRGLLSLDGVTGSYIDKGRQQKKEITRRNNKVLKPLPHTIERYQEAFVSAGITAPFDLNNPILPKYQSGLADKAWMELGLSGKVIGMAPLAAHQGKTWPLKQSRKLLGELGELKVQVVLFGGPEDRLTLHQLADTQEHVHLVPATLNFGAEIAFMKNLRLMLSMDSANMHLAALAGIPVVSIWGATHPFTGFGPVGQPTSRIVQISETELNCRPCSVYGNKACFRKDYACLNYISTNMVMRQIERILD